MLWDREASRPSYIRSKLISGWVNWIAEYLSSCWGGVAEEWMLYSETPLSLSGSVLWQDPKFIMYTATWHEWHFLHISLLSQEEHFIKSYVGGVGRKPIQDAFSLVTITNINVLFEGCYVTNQHTEMHHCEIEGKQSTALKSEIKEKRVCYIQTLCDEKPTVRITINP